MILRFSIGVGVLALMMVSQTGWGSAQRGALPQPTPLRILFIGNSHTAGNDIPGSVKRQWEVTKPQIQVTTEMMLGGALEDISRRNDVQDKIRDGHWNLVVLQGAAISQSHKYTYSQEGAISLAKLAKSSGARALLYAEWPRKGWNETEYILNVYRGIAKASGAEIIPVCKAWDEALKRNSKLDLWLPDGNHSSSAGGYLASVFITGWIAKQPVTKDVGVPSGVDVATGKLLRDSAAAVLDKGKAGRK
jgi:hypothetical protein